MNKRIEILTRKEIIAELVKFDAQQLHLFKKRFSCDITWSIGKIVNKLPVNNLNYILDEVEKINND